MLFAGAGVRGAREEVLALAERVKAPIGHAFGGKEWMQYDNPYDVGMSGLLGYGACYRRCTRRTVIPLGTDFPYSEFPLREERQGGRRGSCRSTPTRPGYRRVGLDLAVHGGDVALTLQAVPLLTSTKGHRYLHRQLKGTPQGALRCGRRVHEERRADDAHPPRVRRAATLDEPRRRRRRVHRTPACATSGAPATSPPTGSDACSASGTTAPWPTPSPGHRRLEGVPGRQVISMSGDGGLACRWAELLTVKLHESWTRRSWCSRQLQPGGRSSSRCWSRACLDHGTDHEAGLRRDRRGQHRRGAHHRAEEAEEAASAAALATPGPKRLIDVVTDPDVSPCRRRSLPSRSAASPPPRRRSCSAAGWRMVDMAASKAEHAALTAALLPRSARSGAPPRRVAGILRPRRRGTCPHRGTRDRRRRSGRPHPPLEPPVGSPSASARRA